MGQKKGHPHALSQTDAHMARFLSAGGDDVGRVAGTVQAAVTETAAAAEKLPARIESDEKVERRDEEAYGGGVGFVTQLSPLMVAISSTDPNASSYTCDDDGIPY